MGDLRVIGREDWCAASRTAWLFEAWHRSLDDEGEGQKDERDEDEEMGRE